VIWMGVFCACRVVAPSSRVRGRRVWRLIISGDFPLEGEVGILDISRVDEGKGVGDAGAILGRATSLVAYCPEFEVLTINNLRTDGQFQPARPEQTNSKSEIQGFFPFDKLRVRMTTQNKQSQQQKQ
jgi:hypothetical protein